MATGLLRRISRTVGGLPPREAVICVKTLVIPRLLYDNETFWLGRRESRKPTRKNRAPPARRSAQGGSPNC